MSRVEQLMQSLRDRNELRVQEQSDAWVVTIPKGAAGDCRVTVPYRAYEWFADVTRNGKQIWSDWMDHYGASGGELDAEMAEDIAAFIERVISSELRLPLQIYEEKT